MSRFGKEGKPRRKSELRASKRTRLSLIALLVGMTMAVASATIFVGAASASPGDTIVTPTAPTATTPSCSNPVKTVTPSSQDGVIWLVNGQPAGATNLNPGDSVAYTASAAPGYEIAAGAQTSFVFANVFDTSTCPPPVTTIDVPAQPSVTDPCNPAGVTDNVTWNKPADTTTFAWTVLDNGDLRVTIKPDNTTFPGGATSHDYTKPADSGVACDTGGGTGGDNGTVKTHNVGTSTTDVNDEPNLACGGFYLDAFGFDGVQQVSWHIVTDTHGDTVLSGSITLDGNGHGYTANLSLPNGMYKLYWHFDGQKGADKHKVFKVEGCTPPTTKIDVPAQPTVTDACGPNNATWNVPANTDTLHWAVNNAGHLIVTIVADNTTFKDGLLTHDFGTAPDSGTACPGNTQVTPASPTATQPSCSNPVKTVTPSSQDGVIWLVNGQPAGATNLNPGDSVAYTASAAPGYEIAAGAQTSFVFANVFDTKTCQPVVIIDHGPKGHHTPPSAGHVVGPQLGTGSDGPTGLQNVSTTSPTLLYTIAGLLALLGLSLSGGGMLVLSRVRRGTHRQ